MDFPTRERFAKWLSNKKPSTVVGIACDMHECPLATYLHEMGASNPYVRPDRIAQESGWRPDANAKNCAPLPEWANEFSRMVDRENSHNSSVLVKQARRYLAAVKVDSEQGE